MASDGNIVAGLLRQDEARRGAATPPKASVSAPKLSLVVSTVARSWQLARLFESLKRQSFTDFEVLVIDQNDDDRLLSVIDGGEWSFPVRHVRMRDAKGLSRGRNLGWRLARGEVLLFPDDDCWYPSSFLEDGLEQMAGKGWDLLCGRAVDDGGRSINGRYSRTARLITKSNVWVCQMEWTTFIRRSVLLSLGGYDEMLGVGATTPWKAAEGPDLILRALSSGSRCYFDPSLCGFHEEIETVNPEPRTMLKMRDYARGMGFVLRKHRYSVAVIAYWVSRPLCNALRYAAAGKALRARYYLSVARGRLEGWLMRTAF